MIIIPAIDLKDGACVRLRQGKMEDAVIFNTNPADQALVWQAAGAKRIHVVDLDGSVDGKPVNLRQIKAICQACSVPIQLGGGIRHAETIRMYLDVGISNVILGTIAATEPACVEGLLKEFPGKIAVGIDAKSGFVAVQGWTEATKIGALELAGRFDNLNPFAFIYTDIERDGMMAGPNIPATLELAQELRSPVILSGGVTTHEDIEKIVPLESAGVMGIIIGRALYEGSINLKTAIQMVQNAG